MRAALGLGSNIEPRRNIESACRRLARDATTARLSCPWWTPAVGSDGPPFLNCVAVVTTPLAPVALRRWLRAVEHDHGRVRGPDPNAPRTLDIDLLAVEAGHGWTLHGDAAAQPFHVLPLAEVLPDLRLPDGRTVREHARAGPLPGATPWKDAAQDRWIERPAAAASAAVQAAASALAEPPRR